MMVLIHRVNRTLRMPGGAIERMLTGLILLLIFGLLATIYIEAPMVLREGLTGEAVGVTIFLQENMVVVGSMLATSIYLYRPVVGRDAKTFRRRLKWCTYISIIIHTAHSASLILMGAPPLLTINYYFWFILVIITFRWFMEFFEPR